jgi:glycerophosphoryl diester phosphodiesterase
VKQFVVWAHRGASGIAPENTLAAFRLAQFCGADGIELDVRPAADKVPVVMHDETLDRTTNAHGMLQRYAARDLQRIDAGSWFGPEFAGEPVPQLDGVLHWAGPDLLLNVEIKEFSAGMAVIDLLERYPDRRVLVSSFDHALLAALRARAPLLPIGFLSEARRWHEHLDAAIACRAESLHPRQDRVTAEQVEDCHVRGIKVYPWVVDGRERLLSLAAMGVDGVFTNYPARLRRWLRKNVADRL